MPVRDYKRGDAFGDLGLICACLHTTSVRCREPGSVWLLQRAPFHAALLATCERRSDSACRALRRVPLLDALSNAQIGLLASALDEVFLPSGAPLLRRGEYFDALFVVASGQLEDRMAVNRKVRVKGLGTPHDALMGVTGHDTPRPQVRARRTTHAAARRTWSGTPHASRRDVHPKRTLV